MDYKVIVVSENDKEKGVEKLETSVKEHIQSGWKLQGGVSVSATDFACYTMAQAMIKE